MIKGLLQLVGRCLFIIRKFTAWCALPVGLVMMTDCYCHSNSNLERCLIDINQICGLPQQTSALRKKEIFKRLKMSRDGNGCKFSIVFSSRPIRAGITVFSWGSNKDIKKINLTHKNIRQAACAAVLTTTLCIVHHVAIPTNWITIYFFK